MSRSYDVAAAALVLDVPPKWLDNVLSRHDVPGIDRSRQGSTRRIPLAALELLAAARILRDELHLPVRSAVDLAARIAAAGDGVLAIHGGTLRIAIDRAAIRASLTRRLADAVEGARRPPRGRPPRR